MSHPDFQLYQCLHQKITQFESHSLDIEPAWVGCWLEIAKTFLNWLPREVWACGMNEAMRQTHILDTSNYGDTSLLQKTDLDKVVKELLSEISGRWY